MIGTRSTMDCAPSRRRSNRENSNGMSLEDVHMNIEAALTQRIGAAGAKLHTARSRNDQVALDLRLYTKAEIAEVSRRLRGLQTALLDLAAEHQDVMMAGYTHLQRAQPI